MQSINLDEGLLAIGYGAFTECESLRLFSDDEKGFGGNMLKIPVSLTFLGDGCFRGCKGLSIVFFQAGSKIKTLGDSFFANVAGFGMLLLPLLSSFRKGV